MTHPDDLLREMHAARRASDHAALEAVGGYADAQHMLADAAAEAEAEASRDELAAAEELLAAAAADGTEGTGDHDGHQDHDTAS